MIYEGGSHLYLAGMATLVEEDRELAWAERSVYKNPAFKWVLGRYVEADQANNNNQYWSYEDLQASIGTVKNSPMNMLHQPRRVVGHYTDAEMMFPLGDEAGKWKKKAKAEAAHVDYSYEKPYVEALGVFYKYYFPEELAMIEAAHSEGALFFSMECIAETVTCGDPDGCGETFQYAGRSSETYCQHVNSGGIRKLNKPHFLAGALLVPPVKPGWSGAEIHDLSLVVAAQADEAERAYNGVKAMAPHLDPEAWENVMLLLMSQAQPRSN